MHNIKQQTLAGLKWLEKYTKTDTVYLAKGSFWAVLSQIAVSGTSFLLAISFAHFISKETYGEYKYILSLVGILGTFTLTGLDKAVQHSTVLGYDGSLNYAFWKNLRWSILFFLASFGVSVYYLAHGNTTVGISMLVAGSLSPFFASSNLYSQFLAAKKDFRRNALYFNMIGNVLPSLFLILGVFFNASTTILIVIYFISNTCIGLLLYYRIKNIYQPNNKIDPNMLNYGKHLSLMGILNSVVDNIDQILVFHYIGAAQLAIYNFAIAIPNQIKGPIKSLSDMIFTKFAERSDADIRSGMKNKFVQLFIFSVIMILVYTTLAPLIYKTFFPKYLDSVFYSQLFSLSFIWITFIPANTYLNAKRKIKEQYLGNISVSMIQIISVFVGVIYFGLLGLVIARVFNRIAWGVVNLFLYNKSSPTTSPTSLS